MLGTNGTLYEKREEDGRLVELFEDELDLLRSGTLRMHRQQPCRFAECQEIWYLSERKNAYHSRQMVAKESEGKEWKFPTSCPLHRDLSKIRHIANTTDLCSKTGKRTFKTRLDADTFATARVSNSGGPLQHSYECEDCGGFHLSSVSQEQQDAIDRAKSANDITTVITASAAQAKPAQLPVPPATPLSKDAQVCQLFREGKSVKEIGEQFEMHHLSVYKVLRQYGLVDWTTRPHKKSPVPSVTSITGGHTVESIEAEIQRLQQKKKMLEEAQLLRVEVVGDKAFKISKEGEHATLPITELEPLIEQLMKINFERTRIVPQDEAAQVG